MTHNVDDHQDSSLSYRDSGVNIDLGQQFVETIKPLARETYRPGVIHGIGGFGALFELSLGQYTNPVLVSGADGVGTKLKLAGMLNRHDSIGIDLVAMCVNDIVTSGAEPLYFMDYFATGKLDIPVAKQVVQGIVEGCKLAGCALVGGETAEMPGMYSVGDYDLAGFSVGIVEKHRIISPEKVQHGDVIIGLESSGPHANGYSLIRKVMDQTSVGLSQPIEGLSLTEQLMAPTKIYVQSILSLLERCEVTAISHITGGGMIDNIPRSIPDGLCAKISRSAWRIPQIFHWIQQNGNVDLDEMFRTFNCGIGMIVCVHPDHVSIATASLTESGEKPIILGNIVKSSKCSIQFVD
ncbi:MAG: phosphoribosylformylglycinamidine cyclo-ligase [Gammaproteobacteria bacterium]|nr:phosphoribosylformylglycinamidine cyclo-ligase [Gammaproteobacteria bacterium]MCY4218102.1 phosphoribosylformylglycinamidine cyclo-ligase [Gammaproteobacteria bacterium]